MRTKGIVAPLILLSAVLVSACDHPGPTAPSSTPSPAPAPTPVPVTDLWNITARLTAVSGGECVGETMQSQIGIPKSHSLSVTRTGSNVEATLKSASGDYACTFTGGNGDASGFTFGQIGYFSCAVGFQVRGFLCGSGERRDMLTLGQDLSGRISGNEISGTWRVDRVVIMGPDEPSVDIALLETTSDYTGGR